MRQITQDVVASFLAMQPRAKGNTSTDGWTLWLHGNPIAIWKLDGSIEVTLSNYPTVTTRERLNGLCQLLGLGRPFRQHKGTQHFGNRRIELDEWITLIKSDGNPVFISWGA